MDGRANELQCSIVSRSTNDQLGPSLPDVVGSKEVGSSSQGRVEQRRGESSGNAKVPLYTLN